MANHTIQSIRFLYDYMKIGNIKISVNGKCSNGVNTDSEFEVVVDSAIQDMAVSFIKKCCRCSLL